MQLHNWAFATRTFREMFGEEGGDEGVDDRFAAGEEMHLAYAPLLLGSGERLFDNLADAPQGYEIAEFVGTPAALHVRLVRKA
jgi:hypothetical protein